MKNRSFIVTLENFWLMITYTSCQKYEVNDLLQKPHSNLLRVFVVSSEMPSVSQNSFSDKTVGHLVILRPCPAVFLKPGFRIVVSVVSVVSVVRKKFTGQIEFILSRTKRCICHFFCIEHLYGRFP